MITCIRDSCVRIPVTDEIKETEWFKTIQLHLIRSETPFGAKAGEVVYKKYYDVDKVKKHFMVPRLYPIETVIPNVKVVDNISEGKDIDIESNIKPRDDRQRECIDYLLKHDNGVICMQPDWGPLFALTGIIRFLYPWYTVFRA